MSESEGLAHHRTIPHCWSHNTPVWGHITLLNNPSMLSALLAVACQRHRHWLWSARGVVGGDLLAASRWRRRQWSASGRSWSSSGVVGNDLLAAGRDRSVASLTVICQYHRWQWPASGDGVVGVPKVFLYGTKIKLDFMLAWAMVKVPYK